MVKLITITINQCTFQCENVINIGIVGLMVLLSQPALVPSNRMPAMLSLVGLKAIYTCPDSCTVRFSINEMVDEISTDIKIDTCKLL